MYGAPALDGVAQPGRGMGGCCARKSLPWRQQLRTPNGLVAGVALFVFLGLFCGSSSMAEQASFGLNLCGKDGNTEAEVKQVRVS
jgi:hypothetical protein